MAFLHKSSIFIFTIDGWIVYLCVCACVRGVFVRIDSADSTWILNWHHCLLAWVCVCACVCSMVCLHSFASVLYFEHNICILHNICGFYFERKLHRSRGQRVWHHRPVDSAKLAIIMNDIARKWANFRAARHFDRLPGASLGVSKNRSLKGIRLPP